VLMSGSRSRARQLENHVSGAPAGHAMQLLFALFTFLFGVGSDRAISQSKPDLGADAIPYTLSLPVDEVNLTFHAADAHGLPVNDLKIDELRVFDNDKPPRRILDFQLLQDFPIRAGILIDSSESMDQRLSVARKISIEFAPQILRQQTDQAFVMDFGYLSKITQPWTSNPVALTNGVRNVIAVRENPLGGTALFDTIFHTCLYDFGKIDNAASGNFILLFTDGEDNASHTSLKEAVDICQRTHTAIYAFRSEHLPNFFSTGPKALAELASETGGRVFHDDDSETEIDNDLGIIEADLRNQYRMIYKAADFKHDGSFHRIELQAPERVKSIAVRSGYYAPSH
jgi:Ca-activated chloride channel family protein